MAIFFGKSAARNAFPDCGRSFSLAGVGMLTSSNPRGIDVANALAEALIGENISAFILPAKRRGCEEMERSAEQIAADPWCSQISVFVGDHP